MSLRETVNTFGHDVSAHFKRDSYCVFAAKEETLGFIDTSPEQNGSRGTAFLCDGICVNFGGGVRKLKYDDIRAAELIESYESGYADELVIRGNTADIRISDFSLNKPFLKLLIDTLCLRYKQMAENQRQQEQADCRTEAQVRSAEIEAAAASVAEQLTKNPTERPLKIEIEKTNFTVPEGHVPPEITEEKIEWISGPTSLEDPHDEQITESDLQDMSREETISYLLSSISEINTPKSEKATVGMSDSITAEKLTNEGKTADVYEEFTEERFIPPVIEEVAAPAEDIAKYESNSGAEENAANTRTTENDEAAESTPAVNQSGLTVEPQSDDIYIRASRTIREICESGRLTQSEIEAALKEKLLAAADRFMEVSAESAAIPKVIAPRIAELKAAAGSMERYFALGEDIAVRVMFFMMYQMLSYADRIVEAQETKERLNDFFKRYGPSGIMLSMLDMRVQ